jgi:hypothetical protein
MSERFTAEQLTQQVTTLTAALRDMERFLTAGAKHAQQWDKAEYAQAIADMRFVLSKHEVALATTGHETQESTT